MKRTHTHSKPVLIMLLVSATLASAPVSATCGGGGGGGLGGLGGMMRGRRPMPPGQNGSPGQDAAGAPQSPVIYAVPWKELHDGDSPLNAALNLYWVISSPQEYMESPVRNSRNLSLYALGPCMQLGVVQGWSSLGKQLLEGAKAPVALLCGADGVIISKAEPGPDGALNVTDVENLVASEVNRRRIDAKARYDAAEAKLASGDKEGAISDYRSVARDGCFHSGLARMAVYRLKQLGVTDTSEVPADPNFPSPNFDKAVGEKIERTLVAGLDAEENEDFDKAKRLYESAHEIDPADPVPLRYLSELYRHDIGDWNKATEIYNEMLKMNSDPLTRAVALHGLGKITIHNGQFKKGLALLEESVKTYPLPLAYRNLAVYWNSEGDSKKCMHYVDEALKLAPDDPYNVVFAAVFMAGNGRKEEALKIARQHEDLLPASYNLAAIYAQAGMKDKALALLKRHFYKYERNQAVRSEEMMEARVDRVFSSLIHDKDFLALTADADGKLPIRNARPGMTAH